MGGSLGRPHGRVFHRDPDNVTRYSLNFVVAATTERLGMMERRTTKNVSIILKSAFNCRSALSTANLRAITPLRTPMEHPFCWLAQIPHFD
jgi:hypothetical protein